jgi:shikimate dehydrogenase
MIFYPKFNVLKKVDGKITGYNTDGLGFMVNLAKHGVNAPGSRMVLLGPGGAGSAILVQAALDGVAHIDVFARAGGESCCLVRELADRVRARTSCEIELHDMADATALKACIQDADLLVNATPIGMGDGCAETPVPPDFIKSSMVVADAIYHPRETQLIIDARARGCNAVPGLGMLIEQAAASEAIWYGAQMPIDQIERELF